MKENEIAKFINNDLKLDIIISVDENNVWISLTQIVEILNTDKDNVLKNIKKVLKDVRYNKEKDIKEVKNIDKIKKYYSLNIFMEVGKRIDIYKTIEFKELTYRILDEYILVNNIIELQKSIDNIESRIKKIEDKVYGGEK